MAQSAGMRRSAKSLGDVETGISPLLLRVPPAPLYGMEVRCAWCRDREESCTVCWHDSWQGCPAWLEDPAPDRQALRDTAICMKGARQQYRWTDAEWKSPAKWRLVA